MSAKNKRKKARKNDEQVLEISTEDLKELIDDSIKSAP